MKLLVFPNRFQGNPYFQDFIQGLQAVGIDDVRLSTVVRLRSNFDAMHLHFPEHVVTQASWLKSLGLAVAVLSVAVYARLTGRPVVRMVHDVEPLWVRRKAFLFLFMKAIVKLTTAYIFLNKSSQQLFYDKNPNERSKPFCFTPHSRFKTTVYDAARLREHRRAHGIADSDILVSFLGSITPAKGLECAGLIPDTTSSGRAVKVAVCGVIEAPLPSDYIDGILSRKSPGTYVRVPRRLTDDELALWIQCSDAVFLSYRLGANSGMSYNVISNRGRIIASRLPMFEELAELCGPSWVRCIDVTSAEALREILDDVEIWREQRQDIDRLETVLKDGETIETGRKLHEFYRRPWMTPMPSPSPVAGA